MQKILISTHALKTVFDSLPLIDEIALTNGGFVVGNQYGASKQVDCELCEPIELKETIRFAITTKQVRRFKRILKSIPNQPITILFSHKQMEMKIESHIELRQLA